MATFAATMMYKSFFLFGLVFFAFAKAYPQQPSDTTVTEKITVQAGFQDIREAEYPGAIIYTRSSAAQVYVQHKGIEMYCDQALLYRDDNFIKAYGDVRTNQGDSLQMDSDYVEYDGETQLAFAAGNVDMRNPDSRLSTDSLFFDRIKQQAYYRTGGTVRDTASTLTSREGRFFIEEDRYQFLDSVVVLNPEYRIDTDHLNYYTKSGKSYLYGPSVITGSDSKIYCERGFYDTRADNGYFVKNARVDYENRTIEGDSIYFDRPTDYASAVNNITVTDTVNRSVIKGHFAEVYRARDSVFITQRALAISAQEVDSVYTHADTLMVTGPADARIIRGFYNARILRGPMSGRCDSIHSNEKTGLTKLLGDPVMWNGLSQVTGDTIHLFSNRRTEQLDSLRVFENAFIIDKDSLRDNFDQIKGKELRGYFKNNNLFKVSLEKNVETLTYIRDEKDELTGIDKGRSGSMEVYFEDSEVAVVKPINDVYNLTYPPEELPENARKLRGFNYRGEQRILTIEDLFRDDPPLDLIKIQGLPLPAENESFFDEGQETSDQSVLKPEDLHMRNAHKNNNSNAQTPKTSQ